jgi:hypothetical protein
MYDRNSILLSLASFVPRITAILKRPVAPVQLTPSDEMQSSTHWPSRKPSLRKPWSLLPGAGTFGGMSVRLTCQPPLLPDVSMNSTSP